VGKKEIVVVEKTLEKKKSCALIWKKMKNLLQGFWNNL